jgi:dCMP deaminase
MRRDWDLFYMKFADQVAGMSSCVRRKVGAVLVKNKHIIATGYNGAVSGAEECFKHFDGQLPDREQHKQWTEINEIHAEQNVIIDICKRRTWEPNMTLYITCLPCLTCALSIITCKISRIVYNGSHAQDTRALDVFKRNRILVEELHYT